MSVSAVIDSTDGNCERSNSAAAFASPPPETGRGPGGESLPSPPDPAMRVAGGSCSTALRAASRLRCDHRAKKSVGLPISLFFVERGPARKRLRIGVVAPSLGEGPLNVVLGHKGFDRLSNGRRHWHGVHKITPCSGPRFALGRVRRDAHDPIGRIGARRAQGHPEQRRAGGKVVAVLRSFGSVEFDFRRSGI